MASELKVNKITPESGVTLTLGDSGDTINFGSGVLPNFENLTVTGDLTVDTNSLKVDSTNNRVGIGTASPSVALDVVGGASFTDNVDLGDNDRLRFGASQDLQIYHDPAASHSYISEVGTGDLIIEGGNIRLENGSSEYYIRAYNNAQVELYYDNAEKLATTSTGIDVTGTVTSDGLQVDATTDGSGVTAGLVSGQNVEVSLDRWSGSGSNFHQWQLFTDVADLQIRNVYNNTKGTAFTPRVDFASNGDISFYEDTGTTAKLFWDASAESLGIGTTSPVGRLNVNSTTINSPVFRIDYAGTNSSSGNILVPINTAQNTTAGGAVTSTAVKIVDTSTGGSLPATKTLNAFHIDISSSTYGIKNAAIFEGGNVGIGTSSPNTPQAVNLHISGTSSAIRMSDTTNSLTGNLYASGGEFSVLTSSSHPLVFKTANSERMRITSSGGVGIGTSSPSGKLNIQSTDIDLYLTATRGSGNTYSLLTSGTNADLLRFTDVDRNQSLYLFGHDRHVWDTSGSERMRIDSSGKVGIGTSSPKTTLQVGDTGVSSGSLSGAFSAHQQVDGDAVFYFMNSEQSASSSTNETCQLYLGWRDGADGVGIAPRIVAGKEGDYIGVANADSYLSFHTSQNNTLSERMRITSSGNVGIGTSSPDAKLEVSGGSSKQLYVKGVEADIWLESTGPDAIWRILGSTGTTTQRFRIFDHTNDAERLGITSTGAVVIPGSLSKGSGSFRIDHPLPEKTNTHHLVHSFVEAPQADNIYRGKVDLVNGTATVNIDIVAGMSEGTFILLNREIQCFTSNETGWTAVKGSVSGNILTITAQDETCTDTISWLVIGERQDQHMYDTEWTDENGKVIVEPLKPVEEEVLENA